ncbi:hypothetical protein [Reyranella sp.]|uniref:hypothetical protein n=1 Tax=Reyranella sp. TaxID=1929291 RepID=UPI0011FC7382|nr:hypothetical protein [Reyranella sp.]TAJ83713.1 MAG: hypothetical protein EPO50_21765 [Reyranella sp.]
MRSWRCVLPVTLMLAAALPGQAQTVGGADYAPQYDFSEFWAATDGRRFQVVMAGNPFPALPIGEVKHHLLPVMQANKPRPNLTFTYETPPEEVRPSYRLALVFDPANDLTAARVCSGQTFLKPPTPGRFYVFGVYCRDDLALSQTTAWTQAAGPDDPRLGPLFAQLFLVLFDDRRWRRFPFDPRFGR